VFGQIKQARGFRQFLLRGLEKVRGEWALICMTHNLLKFHKIMLRVKRGRKTRATIVIEFHLMVSGITGQVRAGTYDARRLDRTQKSRNVHQLCIKIKRSIQ
jgi:hypothetical protein